MVAALIQHNVVHMFWQPTILLIIPMWFAGYLPNSQTEKVENITCAIGGGDYPE